MKASRFQLLTRCAGRALVAGVAAAALSQCATSGSMRYKTVAATPDEEVRNETFGFRKWESQSVEPDTVIIGIHGFCGAAIDYENLGKYLEKAQPRTAVYAYEVRGQGRDPLKERRGDIDDPNNWFTDLNRFCALVRERHPKARIVWFGESMGGLIASNAYHQAIARGEKPPCDALILSSPVVKFRDDFPKWKKDLVKDVAMVFPSVRVSLDAMAGKPVQMTHDTFHSQQAETNSWNIDKHTLLLLVTLGDMVDGMSERAKEFHIPVLVLHGGNDFFTKTEDVKDFYGNIPSDAGKTLKNYPDAYHLLMYDKGKEQVISDVAEWISKLPPRPRTGAL
ncbi:MAG: hypothetical protein JWO82_2390 [Akkermansiaceae bacterium]|nr:hypothetical protein [Akkermansiaceae bacterium]